MEDNRILMSKKKKNKNQEAVDLANFIGDVISTDSALLASSINLMRAGKVAESSGNAEALLKVARAWYDLARYLSGDDSENKIEHFGFAALEARNDTGSEPDEGESGP